MKPKLTALVDGVNSDTKFNISLWMKIKLVLKMSATVYCGIFTNIFNPKSNMHLPILIVCCELVKFLSLLNSYYFEIEWLKEPH